MSLDREIQQDITRFIREISYGVDRLDRKHWRYYNIGRSLNNVMIILVEV